MKTTQALERLEEILEEVGALGSEAAAIFREHFPSLYQVGDAYGAFILASSWNRYNTTLASLVEQAQEDEDDDEE